ncbi:MAG: gamma-glutamyltransferase [Xanthomonadales bacterium]|jgi:gamma-glutamyltranspeptidase/glutathione hydrolase|nr:gamma-glutamyltransferase [Xanthomonadales bacterium]
MKTHSQPANPAVLARNDVSRTWKDRALIVLLLTGLCFVQGARAQTPESGAALSQPIIRYDAIHHPVRAQYGMVVSQNRLATEVGRDILARGGNAIDAAVGVAFALAVTLPRAGNLGGSGFLLAHLAETRETVALDYRSVAPLAASRAHYTGSDGDIDFDRLTFGPEAAGVPGTVAAMHLAWSEHGSLPWEDLLRPARDLARDGFELWPDLAFALNEARAVLSVHAPGSAYLKAGGTPWAAGDRLVQSDLAWSLEQLMAQGAEAFYGGELARRIARSFNDSGGILTLDDLASYEVKHREPVATTYRGKRVVTVPPVSAGGVTLLQMLNMLEHFPMPEYGPGSAQSLHLLAEVMKRAAANRRSLLGDPDFVEVRTDAYISKDLARHMAAEIDLAAVADVDTIEAEDLGRFESRDTTHFSIMDRYGNAVANTYTLGYSFGSGFVAEGTGILFDNQMRNFSFRDGDDHKNALAPGKRMLSTMTPAMVFDDEDRVWLVTGTPGGSRIINVVLQIIVNVVDHGLNAAVATHQPRIHQGWRNQKLGIERGMNPEVIRLLEARGHEIDLQQTMGSTQSILWQDGEFHGAPDPRRPHAAAMGLQKPPVRIDEPAAAAGSAQSSR